MASTTIEVIVISSEEEESSSSSTSSSSEEELITPHSILRRRLDFGEPLDRESDLDTSSSDTEGEFNDFSTTSEEDLEAFDYDSVEWGTNAFLPPMARCQYCLQLKDINRIAPPNVRNQAMNSLAEALNDARKRYTRVVRYGHFHMRMINMVDPRSLLPSNIRYIRGTEAKLGNGLKRYRVLAPFVLCDKCVEIIEMKVEKYINMFGLPPDVKMPEEDVQV